MSPGGSRQVGPPATTRYSIAAVGAGRSRMASTAVTVTPPPPKVVDRLTVCVNFDLDRAIISPADEAELQRAVAFVKKYPGYKLSIEGHLDSLASEQYNQGLSLRRATAVRDYFVKGGVTDISWVTVVGRGQSMPVADNSTGGKGWRRSGDRRPTGLFGHRDAGARQRAAEEPRQPEAAAVSARGQVAVRGTRSLVLIGGGRNDGSAILSVQGKTRCA